MITELLTRLRFLIFRKQKRELDEELRFHLEQSIAAGTAAGLTQAEARRRALIEFGGVESAREQCEQQRPGSWAATLAQDVRYGARILSRSPGFTLVAVSTLALGIGANAAIFSLINAVMLRKLPVTDPKTLVWLGNQNDCCVGFGFHDNGEYSLFSTDSYDFLKKNLPEFEELAAMQAGFGPRLVIVRRAGTQDPPRSETGEFVSGNYFRTFGLKADQGRLLTDADDVDGAPISAVMGYQTWRSRFNGDPSVVGSTFLVNTKPVTVVGIAPQGFYGDRLASTPPDYYLPIDSMPVIANVSYVHGSEQQWLYLIGRIKPGVSQPTLQLKVSGLLRRQLATIPQYSSRENQKDLAKVHVVLTPGSGGIQAMQEQYQQHLTLLMGISGLVLLIACANMANLLLVRGMARKAEMSVRAALGARRGRIVRQLLTESVLLAGLGGLAGLGVAYAGTRMLLAMAFAGAENMPIHASPSPAVLAFACGLSLLTGVLFGMAPAWIASQIDPADALRSGMRSTAGGATLLQRSLVVMQAALSLVLLVGAGLFAQSLRKLEHIDLKLDSSNRYIVHINPQAAGYSQRQLSDFYRTLDQRLHALPGVQTVGITSYTPMEDDNDSWTVQLQGRPDPHKSASFLHVSPEYFDSVGTRLVMGRGISAQDTPDSAPVAVVNQSFVRMLFKPGENPIGHYFGGGPKSTGDYQIVGVVEDTVYTDARWNDHLMYFTPLLQRPPSDKQPIEKDDGLYVGAIVLKTDRPMPGMEELVRKTLFSINPNLSVVKFQTFGAQISDQFTEDRMLARLTLLFGALALLLATLGMYGVTAYTVARRTAEIGIRMALGAERAQVMATVMSGALLQAAVGLGLGVPAALLSVRFIEKQLYGMKGIDMTVLLVSIFTLLLAATLAGLIPSRRAASIDPAQTLRTE